MNFKIKHKIPGRIRVHMGQSRMSFDQADTLQYFLEAQPGVTKATVYEQTQDAVIEYDGELKELMEALKSFHYEDVQLPDSVRSSSGRPRYDIIQAIEFGTPEGLISFCEGIQYAAPVDSFVTPEPWDMPGYDSQVIMAAGAFVSGASIELSADGPIKPPYAVYFQGGLTWQHAKFGILKSLQQCVKKGVVSTILCQK